MEEELKGTPVSGTVIPNDPRDTFPVTFSNQNKGGAKQFVTLANYYAVPLERRSKGEFIYIEETDSTYQLKGGIENENLAFQYSGNLSDLISLLKNGNPIGVYNAATNQYKNIDGSTGALSAIPPVSANNIALESGAYYTVVNAGNLGFAGLNFASGATVNNGDYLVLYGTQWGLTPISSQLASVIGRVTTNENDINSLKNDTRNSINDINNLVAYNGNGKSKEYSGLVSSSRLGVIIPANYKPNLKIRITATSNTLTGSLFWQNSAGANIVPFQNIVWVSDGLGGQYFETPLAGSVQSANSNLFAQVSSSGSLPAINTVSISIVSYEESTKETVATIKNKVDSLQTNSDSLTAKNIINESNITQLLSNSKNSYNDIATLAVFNVNGKFKTFFQNSTISASRLGVKIPALYNKNIKIRITAYAKTLTGSLFWQDSTGGNIVPFQNIGWVSDGLGGQYFETTLAGSQQSSISNLFIQISSTGALPADNKIEFTLVGYEETLKEWVGVAKPQIAQFQVDVANNTSKVASINTVLKEGDITINPYATIQTLSIPSGKTTPSRIQWDIPIAKLNAGDKIKVQIKSLSGANTGNCGWFKNSTFISNIVWTLNTTDNFYYSNILEITVTPSDITNYSTFVVIMQAYNSVGLSADTISNNIQYIEKTNYIDINALKRQIEDMTVPPNLLNTLELDWRGYSSMTQINAVADNTGYVDIQAIINSITDASVNKQYVINVYNDVLITDITKLYNKNTLLRNSLTDNLTQHIAFIITKNYVHLRGIGKQKKFVVISPTNLTASSYQYIQVIYPQGNCIIDNFYTGLKGGRYPIHQEAGGSKSSPDYHGKTMFINVTRKHLGNNGYPVGVWSSTQSEADGTTSGVKIWDIGSVFISENDTPFYYHSNKDFDEPTERHFIGASIIKSKNFTLSTFNPYYADIGSGKRSLIEMVGCNIPRFSISNRIHSTETEMTACDLYFNGGANLMGYSNAKMLINKEEPRVLYFKAIAANTDIAVTGGTAFQDIFGGYSQNIKGSLDKGGEVWGEKRIENPLSGDSQIFSLPYRLGNCTTNPKTLTLNVGGVDYTITFNQNYMKADGSAFAYNSVPVISDVDIVALINTIAPTVFQCQLNTLMYCYTFNDCFETGVNLSNKTINIGNGVVRDYVSGFNTWRLTQAGEKPEAIGLKRCNPYVTSDDIGEFAYIEKSYFEGSVLGLYSMIGGNLYKCGANGTFVQTSVKADACLIAMDNLALRYI